MKSRNVRIIVFITVLALSTMSCFLLDWFTPESDWTRRDMPIDGLTHVVTYNLNGPAGSEKEINRALLRGLNEVGPRLMLETIFGRMDGTKTQDVFLTLEDGTRIAGLGMIKTKRIAGLTHFATIEPATYWAKDVFGNSYCGAKIRLDFNKNFIQQTDVNQRDFQSLFYYDIPCEIVILQKGEPQITLNIEGATLRSLVLNEVWQFRVTAGSYFYNWGHSVTILDGPPSWLKPGWWQNWDLPDEDGDTMQALRLVNEIVKDLESSPNPWLEFNPNGQFSSSWLTYSAGDADQYLNFDRIIMNRQKEYAVFFRPEKDADWDYIFIEPRYNYEWNDLHEKLWALRSWTESPETTNYYTADGRVTTNADKLAQMKEFERIGWMNAPNASLSQLVWKDSSGKPIYVMTIRAHTGADDTLVMFGDVIPDFGLRDQAIVTDNQPMPIIYDTEGKIAPDAEQWTEEQWLNWQAENSFWYLLKDNPNSVNADLFVQYRFSDNTEWAPITCTDSDGGTYTCGYRPAIWDLSASYYMDGDPTKPWHVIQLLGEVGVRTIGLSYASGLYKGTGMEFALDQRMFHSIFFSGMDQESIWMFDARAMQLPDTLSEAWNLIHSGE